MAAYKGSVELISGITQKNGGAFPLMDASAIQYDETGVRVDAVMKEMAENIKVLESGTGTAISEEEIAECFK